MIRCVDGSWITLTSGCPCYVMALALCPTMVMFKCMQCVSNEWPWCTSKGSLLAARCSQNLAVTRLACQYSWGHKQRVLLEVDSLSEGWNYGNLTFFRPSFLQSYSWGCGISGIQANFVWFHSYRAWSASGMDTKWNCPSLSRKWRLR